jgi:hypothetical protein
MSEDELARGLDDPDAFDAAVRALPREGAMRAMRRALRATVPDALAARAARVLASRPPFDVGAVIELGRPGLWLATEALIEGLPTRPPVPWPLHERWDALVEIRRAAPETAWLVAAFVAAMGADQQRLANRALLGVERRFGARGRAALGHATRGAPLEAHVAAFWERGRSA